MWWFKEQFSVERPIKVSMSYFLRVNKSAVICKINWGLYYFTKIFVYVNNRKRWTLSTNWWNTEEVSRWWEMKISWIFCRILYRRFSPGISNAWSLCIKQGNTKLRKEKLSVTTATSPNLKQMIALLKNCWIFCKDCHIRKGEVGHGQR